MKLKTWELSNLFWAAFRGSLNWQKKWMNKFLQKIHKHLSVWCESEWQPGSDPVRLSGRWGWRLCWLLRWGQWLVCSGMYQSLLQMEKKKKFASTGALNPSLPTPNYTGKIKPWGNQFNPIALYSLVKLCISKSWEEMEGIGSMCAVSFLQDGRETSCCSLFATSHS